MSSTAAFLALALALAALLLALRALRDTRRAAERAVVAGRRLASEVTEAVTLARQAHAEAAEAARRADAAARASVAAPAPPAPDPTEGLETLAARLERLEAQADAPPSSAAAPGAPVSSTEPPPRPDDLEDRVRGALARRGFARPTLLGAGADPGDVRVEAERRGVVYKGVVHLDDAGAVEVRLVPSTRAFP